MNNWFKKETQSVPVTMGHRETLAQEAARKTPHPEVPWFNPSSWNQYLDEYWKKCWLTLMALRPDLSKDMAKVQQTVGGLGVVEDKKENDSI
ncbi:MAG: hypothetical protein LLF76_02790 [Planctomycetaceae bacterium]|nr:hypothetical protein [Planctomycetaceae bacterium]